MPIRGGVDLAVFQAEIAFARRISLIGFISTIVLMLSLLWICVLIPALNEVAFYAACMPLLLIFYPCEIYYYLKCRCPYCAATFSRSEFFNPPVRCRICHRSFRAPTDLKGNPGK